MSEASRAWFERVETAIKSLLDVLEADRRARAAALAELQRACGKKPQASAQ
jgi:hypothetical protein